MAGKDMEKITRYFLIVLIIAIALIFASMVFINNDTAKLNKSLRFMRSGNLEEGLELCEKMKLKENSDKCYINYIGKKINRNDPYDQAICDKISEERGREKEKLGCYV